MTTPYVDPQSIHNPTAGSAIPATWGDTVRDDLEFFIKPPAAKAVRTSDQTGITDATWMPVLLPVEVYDTDGFHSTSSNTGRMTVPTGLAGRYLCIATVAWDSSTAGTGRACKIAVNGSGAYGESLHTCASPYLGAYIRQTSIVEVDLAVGDYVEAMVYQDSGGSRTLSYFSQGQISFSVRWVSKTV